MRQRPGNHGRDHTPDGGDPVYAGMWFYVGDTHTIIPSGEYCPPFENGWTNVDSDESVDFVPMRFRILLGPPNMIRQAEPNAPWDVHIVTRQKSVEIQGDVTGGSDGTTVFTLPPSFRLDHSVPFPGHDDSGLYVPSRLYQDGRFVRGIP